MALAILVLIAVLAGCGPPEIRVPLNEQMETGHVDTGGGSGGGSM